MSKIIVVIAILWSVVVMRGNVHGQGTIVFNNLGSTNGEAHVFNADWTSSTLLSQDINLQLEIVTLDGLEILFERKWLLSDGTAEGINVAPGRFDDPSHSVMVVQGIRPDTTVRGIVSGWAGEFDNLLAARDAGEPTGSLPFLMVAGSIENPFAGLATMPDFNLYPIPEPTTGTLGLLSGIALWLGHYQLFRRNTDERRKTKLPQNR